LPADWLEVGWLKRVCYGDDQPFAFCQRFSTPEKLDPNGLVHFSVGQYSARHYNVSSLVDFIYDNIFDTWSFHVGKPLVLELGARTRECFAKTKKKRM
jgi:hypothetical protein